MQAWIMACMALLLAYDYWALDRGLDMTDESYYLAAAIHPGEVTLWATAMHWLTAGLWKLCAGLAGFRALGLGILAAASVMLALGAIRAFEVLGLGPSAGFRRRISIVGICLTGALLYSSFVPFTPSYNLLAAAGVYAGIGLALCSSGLAAGWRLYLLLIFAGAALGIAFLNKFSAGLIAFVVAAALVAAFRRCAAERILGVAVIALAMAAAIGLAGLGQSSGGQALEQFRVGAEVYMLGANETFSGRLLRYAGEMLDFLEQVLTFFGIPLLLFVLYGIYRRATLATLGIVCYLFVVIAEGYWRGGMDRYESQSVPLFAAVALALLAGAGPWMRCRTAWLLIAVLLGLPYAIAIGSYNPMHVQILFSLAPWGALLGVLAFSGGPPAPARLWTSLPAALFVTLVAAQVVSNGLRAPYRLHRPLQAQTERIDLGEIGSVRVDRETLEAYAAMARLAEQCGIAPGSPFLGLYNIPGVALALRAIPVATPILQDRRSAEAVLDRLGPAITRAAVVGLDPDSGSYDSGLPTQLAGFPFGYRSCGEVVFPYLNQHVRIWKPERGR